MDRFALGLIVMALAAATPAASAVARDQVTRNPQHDWCDPEVASNKGHENDPVCLALRAPRSTPIVLSSQPIAGNENCREYRTSVIVDGEAEPAYGVACRRPDGAWEFR